MDRRKENGQSDPFRSSYHSPKHTFDFQVKGERGQYKRENRYWREPCYTQEECWLPWSRRGGREGLRTSVYQPSIWDSVPTAESGSPGMISIFSSPDDAPSSPSSPSPSPSASPSPSPSSSSSTPSAIDASVKTTWSASIVEPSAGALY